MFGGRTQRQDRFVSRVVHGWRRRSRRRFRRLWVVGVRKCAAVHGGDGQGASLEPWLPETGGGR